MLLNTLSSKFNNNNNKFLSPFIWSIVFRFGSFRFGLFIVFKLLHGFVILPRPIKQPKCVWHIRLLLFWIQTHAHTRKKTTQSAYCIGQSIASHFTQKSNSQTKLQNSLIVCLGSCFCVWVSMIFGVLTDRTNGRPNKYHFESTQFIFISSSLSLQMSECSECLYSRFRWFPLFWILLVCFCFIRANLLLIFSLVGLNFILAYYLYASNIQFWCVCENQTVTAASVPLFNSLFCCSRHGCFASISYVRIKYMLLINVILNFGRSMQMGCALIRTIHSNVKISSMKFPCKQTQSQHTPCTGHIPRTNKQTKFQPAKMHLQLVGFFLYTGCLCVILIFIYSSVIIAGFTFLSLCCFFFFDSCN